MIGGRNELVAVIICRLSYPRPIIVGEVWLWRFDYFGNAMGQYKLHQSCCRSSDSVRFAEITSPVQVVANTLVRFPFGNHLVWKF
jgi:hypothetical protein